MNNVIQYLYLNTKGGFMRYLNPLKRYIFYLACLLMVMGYSSLFAVTINLDAFWLAVQKYGGEVSRAEKNTMDTLINNAQGKSEKEKLLLINSYFQDVIHYQLDEIIWSEKDYWATPAEMLAKRVGDCEDYAIAKYLFLLRVGVPARKLRLIYVKARIGGQRSRITQAHMVLGYYQEGNSSPLILDSLISEVLPAEQRTDLTPVFSFNSQGLWAPGQKKSVDSPTTRLSRWRNVLQKINEEGIRI